MKQTGAPGRRIVLVDSVDQIPWAVRLAAGLVSARVQEKIFTPLLHYVQHHPVNIAFTKGFAEQHAQVVRVAQEASARVHSSEHFPRVRCLSLKRFWLEVDALDKKDTKSLRMYSCIYLTASEAELQGMSTKRVSTARSFEEFWALAVKVQAFESGAVVQGKR